MTKIKAIELCVLKEKMRVKLLALFGCELFDYKLGFVLALHSYCPAVHLSARNDPSVRETNMGQFAE